MHVSCCLLFPPNLNRIQEGWFYPLDELTWNYPVMLVESFPPDSYQHYMDTNFKQSSAYRRYNESVPYYLRNRPSHFIKHCTKSSFAAREFRDKDVECINNNNGKFCVRSSTDKKLRYEVDFSVPMCGCESWRKTQFPCKHFYTVFNKIVQLVKVSLFVLAQERSV